MFINYYGFEQIFYVFTVEIRSIFLVQIVKYLLTVHNINVKLLALKLSLDRNSLRVTPACSNPLHQP